MVIDIKKPELLKRQQDLFDFARAYLSGAFPNPERAGCPQDHVLRSFARNPGPVDPSIADHVTCCSPCFNVYSAHLQRARAEAKHSRQANRAAWIRWSFVSAGIVIMSLIAVYAFLMKLHNQPSTAHKPPAPVSQPARSAPVLASVQVLLDLTTAVPERGHQPRVQTPMRSIPAEPRIDLTFRLPIGSEIGMYSVRLTSGRRTEWSSAAFARVEDGEPVLNVGGDFSHIHDGTYELVVTSKGQRLRLAVVIARPQVEQ